MAGLEKLNNNTFLELLEFLKILTIRYQIVGKRRTGVLEISLASLANKIFEGHINTGKGIWDSVRKIIPTDEEFHEDFLRYSDRKPSRVLYI